MSKLKTGKMILIIGAVLCFVVSEPSLLDMTFMPRWLILAGVTLILALSQPLKVPKNLIIPAFLLYLAMALISLTKAYNVGEGLFEVCKITILFCFLITVTSTIKDIKEIAKPFTIGAMVLGLYGLYYIYNIWWEGQGAYFVTMSNRNLWSQANLLLLPFCLYTIFRDKRWWRITGVIASLVVVGNIIIPQTRAAILGLVISVMAVFLFQKRLLILCIIVLLVLGVFGVCLKMNYLMGTESVRVRLCMWKQTLNLIRDKFMVGAGNWQLEIPLYARGFWKKNAYQNEFTLRPHNDFLWVAAELSPVGLVFYISLFGLSIFYARSNPYVIMGLVGYMVIAFFSFPKERASLSMMLIIFIALAIGNSPTLSLNRIVIIIATVLVIFNFSVRIRAEYFSRKVLNAFAWKNWSEVIKLTEDFPLSYINPVGVPVYYYRGAAYEMSDDYNRAMIAYSRAGKAHLNHIYVLSGIGVCYYKFGMYDKSAECYRRTLFIRPDFEGAKRNLRTIKNKLRKGG